MASRLTIRKALSRKKMGRPNAPIQVTAAGKPVNPTHVAKNHKQEGQQPQRIQLWMVEPRRRTDGLGCDGRCHGTSLPSRPLAFIENGWSRRYPVHKTITRGER